MTRHFRPACISLAFLALSPCAHAQPIQAPIELVVQEGHTAVVRDLDYCPRAGLLLSGSEDKTVKLRNLQGKLLGTFRGTTDLVSAVRFLPDGTRFVVASFDGSVTMLIAANNGNVLALMDAAGASVPVDSASEAIAVAGGIVSVILPHRDLSGLWPQRR